MSATTRRRSSYNPPNDKISTSSSFRRFSEDLCQRDLDKGVFHISGFTPYGKSSPQNGDKRNSLSLSMISENGNTMTKLRHSSCDVKPILKKQNSLGIIDYSYVIPLTALEFDSVTSKDKGDRDSVSSPHSSVSICSARAVKSTHNRRVRFNENVSFHEQGLITYCENLHDEFDSDFNENNTIELLPIQSEEMPKQQIFESYSEHVKNHCNKFKKDVRTEPMRKHTQLTQSCPAFGNIASRPAWIAKAAQNVTDNSQTKPPKGNQVTHSQSRSLERAKTEMGFVKYKGVQSKLRRMGFFDSCRNLSSSKSTLPNRYCPSKNRNEDKLPVKSQTVHPVINENRFGSNYTTLREELYDITSDDDTLSLTYVTETCGEESLRSLGDQYARFLKGRYTLDDVMCS